MTMMSNSRQPAPPLKQHGPAPTAFVRIKSLNTKTVRGATSHENVIKIAALHNLRQIAAECGVASSGRIDPTRISLNYRLRGEDTAAAVVKYASQLIDEAGVKIRRKDAIMALEVVVSLPQEGTVDQRTFFHDTVAWIEDHFKAPILSAVVHLDEAAPHCHVLILPLILGRMNGGALAGGPSKIKLMHSDFHTKVGARYGFPAHQKPPRPSSSQIEKVGKKILEAVKLCPELLDAPAIARILIAAFGQHQDTLLPLLALTSSPSTKKRRSFVQIMTAPCKPLPQRGPVKSIDIGSRKLGLKSRPSEEPLSCVDVRKLGLADGGRSGTEHVARD